MANVVIAAAARTPVGAFNGAFAAVPAHELGIAAITAALGRAKVDAAEVDEVVLGQVLTAAHRPEPGAPGRDRRRHPEIEPPPTASTRSAAPACARWRSAARRSALGDARIVVAGGQESMTPGAALRCICATAPRWATPRWSTP